MCYLDTCDTLEEVTVAYWISNNKRLKSVAIENLPSLTVVDDRWLSHNWSLECATFRNMPKLLRVRGMWLGACPMLRELIVENVPILSKVGEITKEAASTSCWEATTAVTLLRRRRRSLNREESEKLAVTRLFVKNANTWVGVSMGGMIAQTAAIHFPDRVASMVSMMSTTGNQSLPDPSFGTKMWFLKKPKSSALEDVIAHEVQYFKAILCTGVTFTPEVDKHILENVTSLVTRSTYKGGDRQMFAVRCAPNRDDDLAKIKTPSLVLHGKDDLLVFPTHGEHTAKAIAAGNSTRTPEEAAMHKGLKILSGMGHYIGPWNYEAVCAELFPFWKEADNASSGAQK